MTFSDAFRFMEEETSNLPIKHVTKIQNKNKRMWKSLRKHILSRREKSKQVEAEILKKKTFFEQQKDLENKLSLAQINGRLSELQDKRDELEEEKQALLSQAKATNNILLVLPEIEAKCECNVLATNNIKITVSDIILVCQQQIILLNNTKSFVIPPPSIDELSSLKDIQF